MTGIIIDEFEQPMIILHGRFLQIYSIVEANGGRLYRGQKYENRDIGDSYEFCDERRSREVEQCFDIFHGKIIYNVRP